MSLTVSDFTLIPRGKAYYAVYRNTALIGTVEKDHVGNWVATDLKDNRLSERRPVLDGDREFHYFASRKRAVMALWSALQ